MRDQHSPDLDSCTEKDHIIDDQPLTQRLGGCGPLGEGVVDFEQSRKTAVSNGSTPLLHLYGHYKT